MLFRFSMAFALAASIVGSAHAYSRDDQILPELPANAPPGECYARVKVPGEPAGPPPMTMGAQWVLNPGPPGSPGPIWCLVPTGPTPVAVAPAVERFGWIRVLCDTDATPARIRGVQQRLHDRGYYRGELSGRYDSATASAVTQFQSSSHISHGGYLSLQTLDVLEGQGGYAAPAPVYAAPTYAQGYQQVQAYGALPDPCAQTCYAPPPPPPVVYQQPCCQQPVYQPPVYQPPVYQQPVYAPPCCQQPVYAPPPCCAQPQPYAVQGGYAQQGYAQQTYVDQGYYAGSPTPAYATGGAYASARASAYAGGARASASASAYASSTSAIQNGWLTWGGMTRY
jgi:peptidoglycan hydrolase-like protein with peptidoglycan-binding domain